MFKRISTLTVCVFVFVHTLAFAHGGATHVMGTVVTLDAEHVVVKTKDGKTLSILLTKETKYRKGKATATDADLKVGARVVVEATGEGDTLTASEIRFASSGQKKGHEGMTHSTTTP
jgi:hypothetical protein